MTVVRMILGAALIASCVAWFGPAAPVSAQPCPDIEVVFARGTNEPPGVGLTGQSFVDALRAQAGNRSLDVYPVNYAASSNFGDRVGFAKSVIDGIRDAVDHVEGTAANCPNTKVVLGGYSQGAVVAGFVTSADVPESVPPEFRSYVPKPMPPSVANHVAAVVLFGLPSPQFMHDIGAPPVVIGPRYVDKTTQLCVPQDTICNGAPAGIPSFAHGLYPINGMPGEGAAFAISKL